MSCPRVLSKYRGRGTLSSFALTIISWVEDRVRRLVLAKLEVGLGSLRAIVT